MQKDPILLPKAEKAFKYFADSIRMARLRRRLSKSIMCERINVKRHTYDAIEDADPTIQIGHYVNALFVMGLQDELLKVADEDIVGRRIQDVTSIQNAASLE